jgi:nitrogen fixation NifU-like protein
MEIFLRVRNEKIDDVKFTTDGCAFTIAAGSVATEMAKGRTFPQCLVINQSAILAYLEKLPPDHEHCALLAALTFQKAVKDCFPRRTRA